MKTYLFIDLSYFIFYVYYARKKYFEFKEKNIENLIENEEFMDGFKNFDNKINQIKKKLKLPKDTIIIFAKDCKRKKIWRNELYSEYKNTRAENNEVGKMFIYTYNNILNKYNFIENDCCEADDVIGVLTTNLYEENKIYIITGDHDYLQLLYKNVEIYNMKFKNLKEKSIGTRENDLMLKILMGDSSDNINAIHSKLGPKTAMKYINNHDLLIKKFETDKTIEINFNLNKKLIDMNEIPCHFKEEILNKFRTLELK